ncbi:ATP-binding protein [Conexibacter stalactiti]|uniref:ATP-binding protein n=1 Tax=Conexibacter stalactiti TaxID=1940611 RepID=A0ABU4HYW5_9ACTN|nr:ATP-binding protein [Conexibacter stalactiti]MDW5598493.1 ATP-binding protein [Conexibacter stalactiti]MEC5039135.1 ATP-binding protein [Conexibacter stalactiti]
MHAESPLFDSRVRSMTRGGRPSTSGSLASSRQPDGALPGGIAVTLAAGPDAPQHARHAAAEALAHWPQDRRDAALLIISELVTNAVRHGARREDDGIALVVRRRGQGTRIEVTDPRALGGAVAESTVDRDDKRSGWGLSIVAELTDRWGVERGTGRTCVWCEIDHA